MRGRFVSSAHLFFAKVIKSALQLYFVMLKYQSYKKFTPVRRDCPWRKNLSIPLNSPLCLHAVLDLCLVGL